MEISEYMAMAGVMSIVICVASYVLAIQQPEGDKMGPYQCGYSPFTDTRHKFEVSFFLVAILFMIFDLEMSLLFPWAMVINLENFYMVMAFLGILTIGLVVEWVSGAIDWE